MPTKKTPPTTTPAAIQHWIETAHKGDWFSYHYGYLPADSDYRVEFGKEVADNGAAAWQAHVDGKVTLLQRKTAEHLYDYRMQRR